VYVELPAVRREFEGHGFHSSAEDLRDLLQVGPERYHRHDAIARIDEQLRGEHQRVHAGARHPDLRLRRFSVQAAHVSSEGAAQLGDAEIVRVEHLARGDGIDAGAADRLGRGLVGLADPEGEHVLAADALVVELADLRRGERAHRGARGERCFEFHGANYSRLRPCRPRASRLPPPSR
jgi:hypothetical protein